MTMETPRDLPLTVGEETETQKKYTAPRWGLEVRLWFAGVRSQSSSLSFGTNGETEPQKQTSRADQTKRLLLRCRVRTFREATAANMGFCSGLSYVIFFCLFPSHESPVPWWSQANSLDLGSGVRGRTISKDKKMTGEALFLLLISVLNHSSLLSPPSFLIQRGTSLSALGSCSHLSQHTRSHIRVHHKPPRWSARQEPTTGSLPWWQRPA